MNTIKMTDDKTGEVSHLIVNETLRVGQPFRLISRSVTFIAKAVTDHPVCGAMVQGISECGKYRTAARVCDTAMVA